MPSQIIYLGHTNPNVVHFAINGIRWDYWLTPQQLADCEFMARKFSSPKALAYAKRRASHAQKQEHQHV